MDERTVDYYGKRNQRKKRPSDADHAEGVMHLKSSGKKMKRSFKEMHRI